MSAEAGQDSARQGPKITVLLASATLGSGSDELGAVLARSFVKTLKEARPRPWRLLLINSGVRLALDDSPLLEEMKALEGAGIQILACGTCLDYFHAKDRLRAGSISNMGEIVASLLEADRVVRP